MNLYDIFLFNGEKDLLESRFKELKDSVYKFVIIEAPYTFSGQSKELTFEKIKNNYLDYPIEYIIVQGLDDENIKSPWDREIMSRNCAKDFLIQDSKQGDVFMLSDMDELPNLQSFDVYSAKKPISLHMDLYYYNFDVCNRDKWVGTVIFDRDMLEKYTLQQIRQRCFSLQLIPSGWHMSYFMTPEEISYKIKSFSHQELNLPEYVDTQKIQERISNGLDLFDRSNEIWNKKP